VADTAGRLLQLLTLLQRRPAWSGPELAEALGVDARTVRRDVERLRDLGYPVDGSPGPHGGYQLGVGADLPPLLLDDDEAMAVAVVLGASAGAAVPGVERGALAALARLDRLLPPRLRHQVAALRASTVALLSPTEPVPVDQLVPLAQACDAHQLSVFHYTARDGAPTDRRVEPYRLVATGRRWYLVAYDLDRRDWRTFRVDRISAVRVPGHTFVPRELADPGRLVAEAIAIAPYRYQAVVRVDAPAAEVARRVSSAVGVVEAAGSGTLLRMGADDLAWLAGRLAELDLDFEVLEPAELRDHLVALGHRLVRAHLRAGGPRRPPPSPRPGRAS